MLPTFIHLARELISGQKLSFDLIGLNNTTKTLFCIVGNVIVFGKPLDEAHRLSQTLSVFAINICDEEEKGVYL